MSYGITFALSRHGAHDGALILVDTFKQNHAKT
jgi:hypothetical protein